MLLVTGEHLPEVFTLAFDPDLVSRWGPPRGLRGQLVFRRQPDGSVTVNEFPEEVDVNEAFVAELVPTLVHIRRGRLYIQAANGEAVYVPVGESRLRGCVRYGRLYVRMTKSG
ncbi:MAG: hypothetical protein HY332_10445 [Chloroflexi bacterium]|nr:hypothetical protein [Chloroflexota bacterium]